MSTMPRQRRWNERTRLIVILELAVVLPAAALVMLSAWHLNHIRRDRAVEAAIQRDFSQVLAISEKQINHKAFELADDVRADFPVPGQACSVQLDRILAAHPYVAHVFLYTPEDGLVFRSQPGRLQEPDFRAEAGSLSKMYATWMKVEFDEFFIKLEKMGKKGTPYYCDSEYAPRGDKHLYQSGFIFAKRDGESGVRSSCETLETKSDFRRARAISLLTLR